jgi:glycosyltransferase involved in cell wall biosynthesis
MKEKIGIAIITYNRQDFFEKVQASIPDYVSLYVVNTGSKYPDSVYQDRVKLHQCNKKTCVGWGKNHGLRMMINDGCEHLFLMEDDVVIKDPDVCKKYIKAASVSGIWHMNFGFSHKENLDRQFNTPVFRNLIDYTDDVSLIFTPNVFGAFTYYHKGIIKNVGYHDERFNENYIDHIELTYRTIKAGLHPPFWWFADINKSWDMISNLYNMEDDSIVQNEERSKSAITKACMYFKQKHGYIPMQIPQTQEPEVLKLLEIIQARYAQPEKALKL